MKLSTALATLALSFGLYASHQAQAKILFYDGFDQGLGKHWLSNSLSKDKISINSYLGNKTLKLKHHSFAATTISTLGYKNIRLQGSAFGSSLENTEQCKLQVSADRGKSWFTIAIISDGWDSGVLDGGGNHYWLPADNNAELIVRASINGNEANDSCFFDNIKLTGERIYPVSSSLDSDGSFSTAFLNSELPAPTPAKYTAFYQGQSSSAKNHFEGRLSFNARQDFRYEIIEDVFDYQGDNNNLKFDQFPAFAVDLVQNGTDLIPLQRGPLASKHPHWEIIIEPGKTWQQPGDQGFSRAALPIAFQQKGANCVHNGMMSFLYNGQGQISRSIFQIGSETCAYFKFDAWGKVQLEYQKKSIDKAGDAIARYQQEVSQRIPQKPLAALAQKYPQIDTNKIGASTEVHPSNMTVFGMVVDGINYVGGCNTRFGTYPFCDVLDLPSYSTAKSVTGLAYLAMVKLHPEIKGMKIVDLVPACAKQPGWQDISIEDALNMTTGHYDSDGYEVDEFTSMVPFFDTNQHQGKITEACHYPRKSGPGEKWVYHTSDTYLFATAIQNYWQQKHGAKADYYRDTLWPLWKKMGLSPMMDISRRSYDQRRQVYAGYGLTYHRGDIAKLASQLIPAENTLDKYEGLLDREEMRAALQMNAGDRGVVAAKHTKYKHAFWAYNAQTYIGCNKPVWIPFMSGFGGNTVAMLPNGIAYYVFSDNHDYVWKQAVLQANKIKPLCGVK